MCCILIIYGLPLYKIGYVQKAAAKNDHHVWEVLTYIYYSKEMLHWILIGQKIEYRVALCTLLAYKLLNGKVPADLSDHLQHVG